MRETATLLNKTMKLTHLEKQAKRKELRIKGFTPEQVEIEIKKLVNNTMEEETNENVETPVTPEVETEVAPESEPTDESTENEKGTVDTVA